MKIRYFSNRHLPESVFTVGDAPMLLEPLKDTIVVAPNDAILECDIHVGEPESEIKWSVIFLI